MTAHDRPASAIASVIDFWVKAGEGGHWFAKSDAFDARFREAFHDLHHAAARRELDAWAQGPQAAQGTLALLILLDQYPRNAFRGTGHMYATDPLARRFAWDALDAGLDAQVPQSLRLFFYLPLSHSEHLPDQQRALMLNRKLGEPFASHAQGHLDIVARFGRFPHRNAMLGRTTTQQEAEFLRNGGFAG
ncbi:MAG: DUF924 family protein [Comamonadaceae bacterium]|nr:MAG: DUF924 family protein [Comamonadaceae bacterium]